MSAVVGLALWGVADQPLQAQMDPSAMSGVPLPSGDMPNASVSVRVVRGTLANNVTDHPVELHGGDQVWRAITNAEGRAEFTGLPVGVSIHAATTVDGEQLESQTFGVPAAGGVRLILVASGGAAANADPAAPPVTGSVNIAGQSRFVIELGDDSLEVYYLLDLINGQQAPVNPATPLVFELPRDAESISLLQGSTAKATIEGHEVRVTGPFAPGRTALELAYLLPYSGETLTIAQPMPAALSQVTVIAQKAGEMHLGSPQFSGHREMPVEGQVYLVGNGPGLGSGETLSIELAGLPYHDTWPTYLTLALALLVVGAGVYAAATPERSAAVPRRRKLTARRDMLFQNLVKVEEQYQTGRLDRARYVARRQELILQLERVYGELEEGLAA